MLPVNHPTSILIVDDDATFLESFCGRFSEEFLCIATASPEEAIELLAEKSVKASAKRYARDVAIATSNFPSAMAKDLEGEQGVGPVWASFADADRFATISVAIVDYMMPRVSGTELLRRVQELPVKKLLLTGKAGDNLAVEAFNQGIIDRFIVKQNPNLSAELPQMIRQLQQSYFEAVIKPFAAPRMVGVEAFLDDPGLDDHLAGICQKHEIVEYYAMASPPGLLLQDANGTAFMLMIVDTDTQRAHKEIAIFEKAPSELMDKLSGGKYIGYFPTASGFYTASHAHDWPKYIWPAQSVAGQLDWRVALVPRVDRLLPPLMFASCLTSYRERRQ